MRKAVYPAVFEPSPSGGYSVYFPDLPGCISFGATFAEAQKEAAEALGLHLYGMEKDGDEIPAPSDNPVIDPETEQGYLVSMVTVYPDMVASEMDNKRVKTNVTIPAWLKEAAESRGVNYSKIMEAALIDYIRSAPLQQ